jgi:hypothetical protein
MSLSPMSLSPASPESSALLDSRPSSAVASPTSSFAIHGSVALVAQQQASCVAILYLSRRFVLAVAELSKYANGVLQPLLQFTDYLFAARRVLLQALGLFRVLPLLRRHVPPNAFDHAAHQQQPFG